MLVVLQGRDSAGKDGTIRHVFGYLDPQGLAVTSFRAPSAEELAHDFLWRVHRATPWRGTVGVFNRSHYEDVLALASTSWAPWYLVPADRKPIRDLLVAGVMKQWLERLDPKPPPSPQVARFRELLD